MAYLFPRQFVDNEEASNRVYTMTEASDYTRWLATAHYENFHVVSFLLPKALHQDFYNVYSFCRWADDLGDEFGDPARSLELLAWWRGELHAMYAGVTRHPVFMALRGTVLKHDLPIEPFDNLITAFVQDQTVSRYADWASLQGYCVNSANPVGRLVLMLSGYRDAERFRLSDATCTGLQLANFWQDVTVDWDKDRVYLPLDLLARNGATVEQIASRQFNSQFAAAMREAVVEARRYFAEGLPLVGTVNRQLSLDLDLFNRGGMAILDRIEAEGFDVVEGASPDFKSRAGAHSDGESGSMGFPSGLGDPVARSYDWCRELARDRAKNFYYAFRLLSKKQHDAICAVYAFMRVCDDLSDDPGMTIEQRQLALAGWRRDLDLALGGLQTMPAHPVWLALYDAVLKYKIPREYLHQMIDGVTSDLEFQPVETFDQLYRYCYQVASVVGLTVIHIFGFKGAEALPLAEKCGIAFQLTNILRDVREDAQNARVYLPAEDLARFGVPALQLAGGAKDEAFRNLMRFEAERARKFYDESRPLVAMVDAGSRASLRALIEIYSQLLDRIVASDYDVLNQRIALSTREKLWILVREKLRG